MLRTLSLIGMLCALPLLVWRFYPVQENNVPAEAESATRIEWQDLIPKAEPLADKLSALPMHIRFDLGFIGKVMADADAGVISSEGPEYRNAISLLEKHRKDGVDVDSMLAAVTDRDHAITQRNEAVNAAFDGEWVSLPGYALPLETADQGVTEFLLVPYVGACIHVPPPPPNQIVLATLESSYDIEQLYEPVLITGQLSAKPLNTELFLVDGEADIPTGYSMQVVQVEPITENP